MEQEQQGEWRALEEAARQRLRKGSERKDAVTLARLLVLPSFENYRGYQVLRWKFEPKAGAVVRFTWRREVDLEKLRTPVERVKYPRLIEPTVEEDETGLSVKAVNGFAAQISALQSPVLPQRTHFGLDGTTYEFAFGDDWVGSRFVWWGQVPAGWEGLERLARMVEQLGTPAPEDSSGQ
jgi:hypothetical protein